MKRLIILLLCLLAAVWVGLNLQHHPGVVIISLSGVRIDMPLWLGFFGLIAVSLLIHFLLSILGSIAKIPFMLKKLWESYRQNRARKLSHKGFVALMEGRFEKAEASLLKSASYSADPWLNYVFAANAAQNLQALHRRDRYLRQAEERAPKAHLAVGLMKAKWQYEDQEYKQSLGTLLELSEKYPAHPSVLRGLYLLYVQLQEWDKLASLLPRLKRRHVLKDAQYRELERTVWYALLLNDKETWSKIPRYLKKDSAFILRYAKALDEDQQSSEAEHLLRHALRDHWNENLIRLYGHLHYADPQKLLAYAEQWLKEHSQDAVLLLILGRLCQQLELWGKAERYLEMSLSIAPTQEVHAELGILFEKMNKPELGSQYFKKGLLLAPSN